MKNATGLAALLLSAGLDDTDVQALTDALRQASATADDEQRGHEADSLWETTYGEHERATTAMLAGREWADKGDAWRGLLYALTH